MLEDVDLVPGPLFRIAVCLAKAREEPDCEKFVQITLPFSTAADEQTEFDMRKPLLRHTGVSDLDMATEYLDCVIAKKLIPMIKAGSGGCLQVVRSLTHGP